MREKPVEWYKQVERFVKVSKVLLKDLDGLFKIGVPADLWTECKITIDWPKEELPRDSKAEAPAEEVMRKYEQMITFLKNKIAPKETDWVKIDRTTQVPKESVHAYYERLLQVFKQYSGFESISDKNESFDL